MNVKRFLLALKLSGFRGSRAVFYRDLAEMYRRAEPIASFLDGEIEIARRTKQKSRAEALKIILGRLQTGEKGGQLGYLLEGVMPAGDAMMIASVERASNKSEALASLATAVEQQAAMKNVMLMASILPAVMLPVCALLISILGDVILAIDKSTPVFVKDQLWQGPNWLAREISLFAQDYGLASMFGMIAFLVVVIVSLPRWTGMQRLKVEGWPVYGLYRDFQAGMLFSSLALMLRTGTPLKAALEDLSARTNAWMRWHLQRVLTSLEDRPNDTIEAFSRGVLSPYMLGRAATLQRSSPSFGDVLIELGSKEGDRVLARVKKGAVIASFAAVGVLASVATFMGLASITVPGKFSSLMEPTALMSAKKEYDAKQQSGVMQ